MAVRIPEQDQAMLAAIINGSEDAIISKDLNSRITSWNKSAERVFGYSEEEMIGQLIHILIPDDRKGEEDEIISRLKRGERIEHFETIRKRKDGKELHISLSISPIRNAAGVIVGASKIARDITAQKFNEERLTVVSDLSKSINAKLDVDTILQIVTDACTRLTKAAFGAFFYNKIDAKGETYMLYALSGAPRHAFDKFGMPRNTAVFDPTFAGTGIVRSDDITKDPRYGKNHPHFGMPKGHLPVVSYLAVPVVSPSGIVIGGLFFGHPKPGVFMEQHEDTVVAIAAQAAIALDNAKLLQEVNALNSKKDQFIGFASHELKTPLTTLKGYLQIARMNPTPPQTFYDKMERQVERLEGIINDLLDISKIQAGRMDLAFERVSLLILLKESIDLVNWQGREVSVENPSGDITFVADGRKLSQVLVNLFSNAVKYSTPGSPVTIRAEVIGDELLLSVTDQGPGIPREHLERIFNEYYRVSMESGRPKGTGLGLFISKEIIQAHSGKIWAESEENVGSCFYVQVPLEQRPVSVN